MSLASWMMALALAPAVLVDSPGSSATHSKRVAVGARWEGQDGHDVVGTSSELKGSDVQDIHFLLSGLPTDREVVQVSVGGEGGDAWQLKSSSGVWKAALVRKPGSKQADLFVEPSRVETGRSFTIKIEYDDGSISEVNVRGKKANPHRRMPHAALEAKWGGQVRDDWVGRGPSVGPDGLEDAKLVLVKLSRDFKVQSARLEGPDKMRWQYGMNPEGDSNAELIRDPKEPTRAEIFFQSDRNLSGLPLKLTITYENGKIDQARVVGGRTDPKLGMPRTTLPALVPNTISARWLGQDGSQGQASGDVHVALSGIPGGRAVVAAVLSDSVRGLWIFRSHDRVKLDRDPDALPLVVRQGVDRTSADLFFPPYRDESGTALTLRLIFADGAMAVAPFNGSVCDPGRRIAGPAANSVVAKPGDDLASLVERHGTVRLSRGTYPLTRPLVLNHPVTLSGEPGAVLQFSQAASEPSWTAAIKIHEGHTTLDGFAVRFTGPIRWNEGVSWGPAVIGVTDNLDQGPHGPKIGLTFSKLDLETPPPANPQNWGPALRLMRLVGALSGRIEGNVLRGGFVELFGGPWQFVDNEYRGTWPGTFSPAVLAVHFTHDLVVRGNRARSNGPSGKTWRFLVLTQQGIGDRVENNTIEGIGPRDDDTIPWANSLEIFLTEAYQLRFEGKPAAISTDGRIVRIGQFHGQPARTGDVVAVLSGPHAGEWRRVAEAIDPTTYLLESPLPEGTGVISIATGFVNERFEGNTIDTRGGRRAINFVFVGNHFGTRLINNRLRGAGESCRITAAPTELPVTWGWSHAPFLGAVIEGNVIEDAELGGNICVEHADTIKTSQGRVYMTVTLKNNVVRWTEPFLSQRLRNGEKQLPPGLRIGALPSLDPGELVLNAENNRLQAPEGTPASATLQVNAAIVNGKRVLNQGYALPLDRGPKDETTTGARKP